MLALAGVWGCVQLFYYYIISIKPKKLQVLLLKLYCAGVKIPVAGMVLVKVFMVLFLFAYISEYVQAQDIVYWRSESTTGDWEWGSSCNNTGSDGHWYWSIDGGNRNRPDCYVNRNIIHFNNLTAPTMNLNSTQDYTLNQIQFDAGSNARTINTDASRSIWFKQYISSNAKIQNNTSVNQTFNVKIKIEEASTWMEFRPEQGDLLFTDSIINRSGNTIYIFGNQQVIFTGNISSTTGAPGVTISGLSGNAKAVYSGVTKTYLGPTTINSGATLQISSDQTLGNIVLNTGGTLIVDAGKTLTITGTWTGGGTIINNGTIVLNGPSSFPGSGSTISAMTNLTVNSGVTLDKALAVSGILTLTNGIATTTAVNLLSVSNTATAAITGYSSTGYIKGPLQRTLLNNIAADGTTYFFPVGDETSNYRPFELVNIRTGSISPIITVTVASTGASTSAASIAAIAARNWRTEVASGNFTSATIRITEGSLGSTNVIGSSTAQSGNYTSQGGNSIGSTIASNAGVSLPNYFAIGTNPTITLADNGTQITAANVGGGISNWVLHRSSLTVTAANATLSGMTCTTFGTYVSADITNLKVYFSTSSTFNAGTATLLSTLTTPGAAGAKTFPSFTSQVISNGTTGYIYITADIAPGATVGRTIGLSALTTSNFTFNSGTTTGSTTSGGAQTITASVYYNNSVIGANNLQTLSNWGTNTDGTGTAPANFTANNQIFNIYNGATNTIGAIWAVQGTGSKIVVGDGTNPCNFTVPAGSALTTTAPAVVDVSNNGTLTITNAAVPTLGTLSTGSTVDYKSTSAQNIKAVTYYNLICSGTNDKTFNGGCTINGTFTISGANTVFLNTTTTLRIFNIANFTMTAGLLDTGTKNVTGNVTSIINITGNFNKTGGTTNNTSTSGWGQINFKGGGTQSFDLNATTGSYSYLDTYVQNFTTLVLNTAVMFAVSPISAGTWLTIETGSTLIAGTNQISFDISTSDITVDGTLKTANTAGLNGSPSTTLSSSFSPTITLGAASTIEYNGGSPQTVTGRTDYANLTINNSAGTTTNGATTVSGVLTFSNGSLTTTTANILSITNNSSTAVVTPGIAKYVSGPMKWTLATGQAYTFPVGKGGTYYPFDLTPTGSAPVIQVEAFNADAAGTVGSGLSSLSTSEYWSASISSALTYTNGIVGLTRQTALGTLNAIGRSATKTGTYSRLNGTVSSASILNSDATGTTLGYFVMAVKTNESITTGSITGTTFCSGASGISVPFTYSPVGNFPGAVFTAQLSDGLGSFASPVNLQTVASNGSGSQNISVTIPSGTAPASGYRIRVISDVPAVSGSDNGINLTVNASPMAVTVTPSSAAFCVVGTQQLVASGGGLPSTILAENFNAATNTWTKINNSTGGTPANAAWTLRPDGYLYKSYGPWHSNDISQFYMSNSDAAGFGVTVATILQTPSFSTVGYSAVSLNFYHYLYRGGLTATAKIELSTDGSSWSTLQTYSTDQGSISAFANPTIVLTATFLNQPTVYVRFKYDTGYTFWWCIDNVTITGTPTSNPITWSPTTGLYTDASATIAYTGTILSTVYAKPSTTTIYTATATAANGCTSSGSATVTINPLPVATATSNSPVCTGGTINLTGGDNGLSSYTWTNPAGTVIGTNTTIFTQNFNTLASSGSNTWTDSITLTGWYAKTDLTANINTYSANTGATITGALYSYGVAGTNPLSDRALGFAPSNGFTGSSGTGKGYLGRRIKNTSGATLTSITVKWSGEQWRKDNINPQNLKLFYQTGLTVSNLTVGSWIDAASVFTSPNLGATGTALDGNAPANRIADITATIPLSLAPNNEIMLRWEDLNDLVTDHLLAIDDVTITYGTNNTQNPSISNANTHMTGVYTLTVTDVNGCSNTATTTVTVDTTSLGGFVNTSAVVCNGSNSGTLTLTSQRGNVIRWEYSTNGGSNWTPITNTTTSQTYLNLTVTTLYRAVVQNGACASANSTPATITMATALSAGAHNTDPITECAGYNPFGLNINAPAPSGGLPPYSYNWQLNGTSLGAASLSTYNPPQLTTAGTYSYNCVVTDSCGSAASTTPKVITIIADPTVTITGVLAVCKNASSLLTANVSNGFGSITYKWQSGPTITGAWTDIPGATSATYSPPTTAAGTFYYQVVVSASGAGCDNASAIVTFVVYPLPTAVITPGGPTTFCQGGSVTLTASGGTGYVWSNTSTTAAITVSSTGIYTVTVTDGNGCTNTASSSVTVNTPPVATASSNSPICAGATLNLYGGPDGMSFYNWAGPNGYTANAAYKFSQNFDGLVSSGSWSDNTTLPGWYARTTATATISTYGLNYGNTSASGLYSFGSLTSTERGLGYAPYPGFTGIVGTGKGYMGWRLKNNTGVTVPNMRISWTGEQWRRDDVNPETIKLYYQIGPSMTNLITGAWFDANSIFTSPVSGSTATLVGTDIANRTENISAIISTPLLPDQEIMLRWEDLLDAEKNHFMAIDDVAVTFSYGGVQNPSIPNATELMSGVYTLTVTDANGCSSTASTTVIVNPLPAAVITAGGPTTFCPGGSVELSASGGTGYSYVWSTGASTQIITATTTGSYTVTVTNTYSCSAVSAATTVTVVDNVAPAFTPPAAQSFCVENIISASYYNPTMDITPDRPEYYLFKTGDTHLDLNTSTFSDNCSLGCGAGIRWLITFSDLTTLPATGYYTGQPSTHTPDIQLPGSATADVAHTITYWIVDCNGNVSLPQSTAITIKPRPDIIKQ